MKFLMQITPAFFKYDNLESSLEMQGPLFKDSLNVSIYGVYV
jgi:hypothetical protein